jgi:hypothetical protein
MASPYTDGALAAAAIGAAIGDNGAEVKAGMATKTASETTLVITHSFTAAPDFYLAVPVTNTGTVANVAVNTTQMTITRTTAAATWTVAYVMGYTA